MKPRATVGGLHCDGCRIKHRLTVQREWQQQDAEWGDRAPMQMGAVMKMLRTKNKYGLQRRAFVMDEAPQLPQEVVEAMSLMHVKKPQQVFAEPRRKMTATLLRMVQTLVNQRGFTVAEATTAVMKLNGT